MINVKNRTTFLRTYRSKDQLVGYNVHTQTQNTMSRTFSSLPEESKMGSLAYKEIRQPCHRSSATVVGVVVLATVTPTNYNSFLVKMFAKEKKIKKFYFVSLFSGSRTLTLLISYYQERNMFNFN